MVVNKHLLFSDIFWSSMLRIQQKFITVSQQSQTNPPFQIIMGSYMTW